VNCGWHHHSYGEKTLHLRSIAAAGSATSRRPWAAQPSNGSRLKTSTAIPSRPPTPSFSKGCAPNRPVDESKPAPVSFSRRFARRPAGSYYLQHSQSPSRAAFSSESLAWAALTMTSSRIPGESTREALWTDPSAPARPGSCPPPLPPHIPAQCTSPTRLVHLLRRHLGRRPADINRTMFSNW